MIIKYKIDNVEKIIDNILEIKKVYDEHDESKLESIIAFKKGTDGGTDNDIRICGSDNINKFRYIYLMNDKGETIESIKIQPKPITNLADGTIVLNQISLDGEEIYKKIINK